MVNLYYDLHIHSCLSPCGDDDMTPQNIAGMAMLKGLDVIALTDHNTARNCPAMAAAAQEYGLLFIPGMEINTSEEIHAVCLFETVEAALAFDKYVYEHLIKIKNKPEIYGHQYIYDYEDKVIEEEPYLLINATDISMDKLWGIVKDFQGVMFPAHVDKSSNSLIANLGSIPPDSEFRTAEIKDMKKYHELKKDNPYLENCHIVTDSDAHYLQDIHEAELSITVRDRSVRAVLDYLADKA